jgi:hypothetical protein
VLIAPKYLGSICKNQPEAPEKLNDANTRLEEKLVLENIFEA